MKNKIPQRLLNYLLLALLIILADFILTLIFVIATGDRILGMRLSVIPGVIVPQFLFGLIFIKHKIVVRLILSAFMTACIYAFLVLLIQMDLIKTNLDIYGIWDLRITIFLAGLILWELFYQVNKQILLNYLKTKKQS